MTLHRACRAQVAQCAAQSEIEALCHPVCFTCRHASVRGEQGMLLRHGWPHALSNAAGVSEPPCAAFQLVMLLQLLNDNC